jgi:hypothetical protein
MVWSFKYRFALRFIAVTILSLFLFTNCRTAKHIKKNQISKLRFIGEQIIPENTTFDHTIVGGLSSIDYANGKYYLICDDKNKPIRFYEMVLTFDENNFSDVEITKVTRIKNSSKLVDPEALRIDKQTGNFIWTSEGAIRKHVNPAIFEIKSNGESIKTFAIPELFKASDNSKSGPRQNGTFEGLSISENYIWIGMELPLKQDGEEPQLDKVNSPVRISKINRKTGLLETQFAYQLEPIPKDSKPSGKFMVNGLPEILEIGKHQFLFIERAYASGHSDGGNTVKIFTVNSKNASDISKINALKTAKYTSAKKTLLFDFESIRSQLTKGIVDNIEGICFGPKLTNGHHTLVVVSDNNFNKFSKQLNQIIVFEVIP